MRLDKGISARKDQKHAGSFRDSTAFCACGWSYTCKVRYELTDQLNLHFKDVGTLKFNGNLRSSRWPR